MASHTKYLNVYMHASLMWITLKITTNNTCGQLHRDSWQSWRDPVKLRLSKMQRFEIIFCPRQLRRTSINNTLYYTVFISFIETSKWALAALYVTANIPHGAVCLDEQACRPGSSGIPVPHDITIGLCRGLQQIDQWQSTMTEADVLLVIIFLV